MTEEAAALRIYIDYDYLAAGQLGELLSQLHEIYGDILYWDAPHLRQLPTAPQARLQVAAINTGGSIVINLTNGITQVVGSADPALVGVTSGLAALAATGTIILRLLSRSIDLRTKWRRDNREDEAGRLQLHSQSLDVMNKELELRARAEAQIQERRDLAREVLAERFPARAPEQQDELAGQLVPHLDAIVRLLSEDNIRQVTITVPGTRE